MIFGRDHLIPSARCFFRFLVLNRLVPISIAIFRYMMICKALFVVNYGERKLSRMIYKAILTSSVLFGVTTFFHLSRINLYLRCNGQEERFLYNFPDFFFNPSPSSKGSQFIKLPFFHPYRLALNTMAFSFILIVPYLYLRIYKFRNYQAFSVQGIKSF